MENPGVSDFPAATVLTSVTTDFKEREPEVAEMLSNLTFETAFLPAPLCPWP